MTRTTDDGPDGVRKQSRQDQGSTNGKPTPRRRMIKSMLGSNDGGTLGEYIWKVSNKDLVMSWIEGISRPAEYWGPSTRKEERKDGSGKEGVPTWRPGEPWVGNWDEVRFSCQSLVPKLELVLPWSFLGWTSDPFFPVAPPLSSLPLFHPISLPIRRYFALSRSRMGSYRYCTCTSNLNSCTSSTCRCGMERALRLGDGDGDCGNWRSLARQKKKKKKSSFQNTTV